MRPRRDGIARSKAYAELLLWKKAAERDGWFYDKGRGIEEGELDIDSPDAHFKVALQLEDFRAVVWKQGNFAAYRLAQQYTEEDPPVSMEAIRGLANTPELAQQFCEGLMAALIYAVAQARETAKRGLIDSLTKVVASPPNHPATPTK